MRSNTRYRLTRRSTLAALTTASALAAAVLAAPPSGAAAAAPRAVPNTHPAWTSHATYLGRQSAKAPVRARVYLAPRGGIAALERDAYARSTPGSATYGHFLTPNQYAAKYNPTSATVKSVRSWLTSHGMKITTVARNARFVAVRGSAKQAEATFGTSLGRYRSGKQVAQAPNSSVRVPANLAASVLTVSGLDTKPQLRTTMTKTTDAPPAAGFRNARPCSSYFGQLSASYQRDYKTPLPKFNGETLTYAPCGYTGPQLRATYEGNTSLDGSGIHVAILDAYASPTIVKDTSTYAERHGDGSYATGQLTQTKLGAFRNQADCGPSGWYGEETLDIEAVHAMAPAADILYYGARSCEDTDLDDALARTIDDDKADVVSNSYGNTGEDVPADLVAAEHALYLKAATYGMSVLFSSGDSGDELANTGIKQADYSASDPAVTAVGGTATGIGADGSRLFDTAWGTENYSLSADSTKWVPGGYLYGGGGGTSVLFDRPSYQAGVAPAGGRQVPDVAMDADPTTGMLVGETQTFSDGVHYGEYRIGGTSLASPLFAGFTALSLQKSQNRAGLLNPLIYKNATSGVFKDVKGNPPTQGVVRVNYVNGTDETNGVSYFVRTFNQNGSLVVKKGYDNATGVGVPTTKWLSALPK